MSSSTMHLLVHVSYSDPTLLRDSRDHALAHGFNQINGIAMQPNVTRSYLADYAIGSTEPGEVAFAAEVAPTWSTTSPFLVYERVHHVLKRETVCPGDFNRDGVVNGQDDIDFGIAFFLYDPYADWNMDGAWMEDDELAFDACWEASVNSSTPCPCPP